ncbi:condensation domain-containing protein [Prescottella defluvii]|uniref:condensation domain-containing protein n=1 Tax=Prescottella defluvii TaxID=1323361 RepID=UPI0004F2DE05|nr:condensation domain-containing protein [Prescottella defluvii]
MHVTAIDRYHVTPGELTEWLVTPDPGTVTDSDLLPSYNQHFHLETARIHGAGRSVWMAAAFDLPIRLDREALARAFRLFIERHDSLHTGFEVTPDSIGRVDFDPRQVRVTPSPSQVFTASDDLRDHLRGRFTEVCDPLTAPAYMFATIERDTSSTIIAAFDHTLVDGYSLVFALADLRRLYEECAGLTPAVDPHPAGSFVAFCRDEARSPAIADSDPRIAAWAHFYSLCGGTSPSFPLDLGVEAGSPVRQAADVRPLLDAEATAQFEQLCVAAEGSVFTGVLTAMGTAIRRAGGPALLPLQFPLHARNDSRWAEAIGWLTTNGPITVYADDVDFTTDLARTHASFRAALDVQGVSMAQVRNSMGDRYRRVRTDVFMASYIDYRRLPGTADHATLNAHHISNVTVADDAQFWISRTESGLALRSRFPDTAVAHATIEGFLTELRAVLTAACRPAVVPAT